MIIEIGDVVFGMSEMKDGNMDYRFGEKKDVSLNRRKFFARNKVNEKKAIFMNNEHGSNIVTVQNKDKNSLLACDALLTRCKNLPLAFTPADCMPIFIWNREYIGLIHAGKNGTIGKILLKTLMHFSFISRDFPINIYFGDCIKSCCYRFDLDFFKKEVYKLVPDIDFDPDAETVGVKILEANLRQVVGLRSVGLGGRIMIQGSGRFSNCTCCSKDNDGSFKYFSHARSNEKRFSGVHPEGRNLAFISRR